MYKALWSTVDTATASGQTSDLVEAIDTAVEPASTSSTTQSAVTDELRERRDRVLFAADAACSSRLRRATATATFTVAHPSPWVTTVGAGTHNRSTNGLLTLGDGATHTGASVAPRTVTGPFIDSTAAGLPGANTTAVALCFTALDNGGTPVLDPAKVAGKIVLCDRGTNARVAKADAVKAAGGIGMVLVNTSPNSLNADFHSIPSIHLADTDRTAVKAYAATAGATATVHAAEIIFNAPAPQVVVAFSSRGLLRAGGGDHLKPRPGRARPGHPGGVLAGVQQPELQPDQRHVDVEPARRGSRRADDGSPPELDADDDQVGAHDLGVRYRRPNRRSGKPQQRADDREPRRRPCAAEQCSRSGPGVQPRLQRLAGVPLRHNDRGGPPLPQRAAGAGFARSERRERPSIAIGDLTGADGAAAGDERRQQRRDIHAHT